MKPILYIAITILPFIADAQLGGISGGALLPSVAVSSSVYRRQLSANHYMCGAANSSNIPVLFYYSDPTLKTIANGGHVQNVGRNNIRFFTTDTTSLLSWHPKYYDSVNGAIYAWVNVPTMTSSTNTIIYIDYGSPIQTTFSGGALGAAWTNGLVVYYMDAATGSNLTDQSGNSKTLTQTSSPQLTTTGQTYYADSMSSTASNYFSGLATNMDGLSTETMVMIGRRTAINKNVLFQKHTVANFNGLQLYSDAFMYYEVGSNSYGFVSQPDALWHIYTMVFNGGNSGNSNRLKGYVDSTQQTLTFSGTIPTTTPAAGTLYIGRDAQSGDFQNGLQDMCFVLSGNVDGNWITTFSHSVMDKSTFWTVGAETH